MEPYFVFLIILVAVLLLIAGAKWILERRARAAPGRRFQTQVTMLGLVLLAVLALVLVLPIEQELRGQTLAVLGILLSAAIALSSPTFLGNLLAGFQMRSVRNFRLGDYLRCGEHFGRVTERGLFHTEIQTEDRDLTTLPNLYLATHPMTVIRASGTIVSATVSLGYDVPRGRVEELLCDAAREVEITEPFVKIIELGDFSVTYRVAGLLADVKKLLSTRSRLRGHMLDRLHGGGVEIVSPTFMNTRAFPLDARFVPRRGEAAPRSESAPVGAPTIEEVAFDKAELAGGVAELERRRGEFLEQRVQLAAQRKASSDREERSRLKEEEAAIGLRIERIEKAMRLREENLKREDDRTD
jgi:small conductance mechanosensitive channel